MKCDMKLLNRKGDRLGVSDMLEVFGCSRSTLHRYESLCIDGFPKSSRLVGLKSWPKSAILAYVTEKDKKALEYTKLMNRGRSA